MFILSYTGNTSNTHIVYTPNHTYTYITHTHTHSIHEWNIHIFTCILHMYTIHTPLPPRMCTKYKYTYTIRTPLPPWMDIKYKHTYTIALPFLYEWIQFITLLITPPITPLIHHPHPHIPLVLSRTFNHAA